MAELGSVNEFLRGKTLLVTGSTGFLAKIFVEEILRVQPDIKKLYLLVRASNPYLAKQRLHNEVFGKDLFRVLRDKWGADFDSFIAQKVVAVSGDVSLENLGIKGLNLREEMLEEINLIVHTAVSTKFDERYDIAMAINTMGAFNVLNLAKNCRQIEILLHVSTAYVCGEAKGLIIEEPFHMGQTLKNGSSRLDIDLEKQLIEARLNELRAQNANEETITLMMQNFGVIRANLHGWPNTYVFTKAMGEMLLVNMKDNLPLAAAVIVTRPTCVISTHSEPFPGWIEDVRTLDFVVVEYGKETVTSFVGHPETIIDAIPADMVINSMIIAPVAQFKNPSKNLIYHIGSSSRNPFKVSDLQDIMYCYFKNNPWVDKYGKPVAVTRKLTVLSTTMDEFHQNKESKLEHIVDLYRPYALLRACTFDVKNAEKLRMAAKGVAAHDGFNFDPKSINWKEYMMNVHIPGVMKYTVRSKM